MVGQRKGGNALGRNWRKLLWLIPLWQPVTDFWARTTAWPVVGRPLRHILTEDHYDVTFIPINQDLETGGSTVLPRRVVEEVIRRSSHRVILPVCLCRVGCRCDDFPMEIGCIFMGEGARDIHPSVGRAVSVEEALEHLDRAVEKGLIPQIGKVDPDPLMLGCRDRRRFLTLCFCCTCCCIAMRNMPRWAPEVKERMHRLEGLRVEVNGKCNGCGLCVDACFASAIELRGGQAVIGDGCKGCGLCAEACKRGAIDVVVEDGQRMLDAALRHITRYSVID
jgi:ferredoxin